MELKTLKDLDRYDEGLHGIETEKDGSYIYFDDLKEEVIKDIKAIRKAEKEGDDFWIGDFCFYCRECVSSKHVIDYIRWKFNITEEELK